MERGGVDFDHQGDSMKLSFIALTFLISLSATAARMDVKCVGEAPGGETLNLSIQDDTVSIKVADAPAVTGRILGDAWDGHIAGLLTGKTFAVKYENNYGCITDVELTAIVKGHLSTVAMKECVTTLEGREYCRR